MEITAWKKSVAYILIFVLLFSFVFKSSVHAEFYGFNPSGQMIVENYISEEYIRELYLSEEHIQEQFLEEQYIIENIITETLLKEKVIEEVYRAEVLYIPQEKVYSYFDNDLVSDDFGSRIDFDSVVAKFAAGTGILAFVVMVKYLDVKSPIVVQGVMGAGIGAALGAVFGGLDGALSEIDESGRSNALSNLALGILGVVLSARNIFLAPAVGVSLAAAGGASLVVASVLLAAATIGAVYSLVDCVKSFQSTNSFDIDWNNIDWDEVGYSAAAKSIEGAANGFLIGAVVGTISGAARSYDSAKFMNTLPKRLLPLTPEQRSYLKTQKYTDKQIQNMDYNSETGNYYIRAQNANNVGLEVKTEAGRVKYKRQVIELKGVKVEGVFPDYKPYSKFQHKLSDPTTPYYAKECNETLLNAISENPGLKSLFTADQIINIQANKTPPGYVWHHSEIEGVMQLVPSEIHMATSHTGGNSLWGANQGSH